MQRNVTYIRDIDSGKQGTRPMKTLSNRGKQALDILRNGGYFRNQLESGWQGREQFKTRLRNAKGQVVPGLGFATLEELKGFGYIRQRDCLSSSTWPSEFELKTQFGPAY